MANIDDAGFNTGSRFLTASGIGERNFLRRISHASSVYYMVNEESTVILGDTTSEIYDAQLAEQESRITVTLALREVM